MATKNNLLIAALNGTAWRRAAEKGRIDEAVAERSEMACGRLDLLAQAGGTAVGSWYARPSVDVNPLLIGSLLVGVSGRIDSDVLTRWTRVGYDRASAPAQGTATYGTPSHQRNDHR